MSKLSINCPYCGKFIQTDLSNQIWAKNASEVLTVPVIERLGQLATTKSWESKKKDSRLFGLLSIWNKTVGLLRGYQLDPNVMKRELHCDSPECNSVFDCYINLEKDHSFSDFWPHLTGKVIASAEFSSSGAKTSIEKFISVGEKLGINPNLFISICALSFCLLTLIPYSFPFLQKSTLVTQTIIRTIAIVLVAFMILTIKQISEHFRSSLPYLRNLLIISNHNSFQFWHNFSLGRITGVSFPKEENKQNPPSLQRWLSNLTVSQAFVVGGIPSVIIATIIWSNNYLPHLGTINLAIILEFVFWITVAYFTGISSWIGFNIGVFVIENISLIPMKLTPLNEFNNLDPVIRFAILSLKLVIPIILLPLVFLISSTTLPDLQSLLQLWLLPWMKFFLGLGFFLIGIGDIKILLLGIMYMSLLTFLPSISISPLNNLGVSNNYWISITFGIFLSILLIYHFSRAFTPLLRIAEEKKQETIELFNHILLELSDDLNQTVKKQSPLTEGDKIQIDTNLNDIKNVIALREKILATKVNIFNIRTNIGIISPFISSILLPVFLDILMNQLIPIL